SVRSGLLDRADVRALVVDDHEQLERRVALRASYPDDPRGFELSEHADVRARVVLPAHAAVVALRLFAKESEDVHRPAATVPTRSAAGTPSRHAKKASWSAAS